MLVKGDFWHAACACAANPDGSAVAKLLILSDHPVNGRPRLYTLTIPPA